MQAMILLSQHQLIKEQQRDLFQDLPQFGDPVHPLVF
jgi:hypothetical protein